ncbi:hypothetical protein [Vulgatibacter sp.]|uniref:hypothetical protein n=1 Tax=Vulgatibacter sp. TaxID=1971226 RepID=UPI0035658318
MAGGAAAEKMMDAIPAGSFRADVLESARRFKASWLDLARHLVRVRGEGIWQEWGYATFEAYCARELRIKKATAQKLVQSYGFLEKHEPEVLEDEDRARKTPSFEVIEVLSKAEERGQLDDQTYREVREKLWEQPVAPAEIKRELAKRFPEPEPEEPPVDLTVKRLAAQARKLARDLSGCGKIPRAVAERAAALAEDVEELCR